MHESVRARPIRSAAAIVALSAWVACGEASDPGADDRAGHNAGPDTRVSQSDNHSRDAVDAGAWSAVDRGVAPRAADDAATESGPGEIDAATDAAGTYDGMPSSLDSNPAGDDGSTDLGDATGGAGGVVSRCGAEPGRPGSGVKWSPGHYVSLGAARGENVFSRDQRTLGRVAAEPLFRGVKKKVHWNQIEIERDVYDFTLLDAYVAWAEQNGKVFLLELWDRCFAHCEHAPIPDYLLTDPQFSGGDAPMKKREEPGYIARVWDAAVVGRFVALLRAIGERYDENPYFGAVRTAESATGPRAREETDFTLDKYLTQLLRLVTEAKKAMPHTLFVTGMNFIPGGYKTLDKLAAHIEDVGGGIGSPDTLPRRSAMAAKPKAIYEIYRNYRGRIAALPSAEVGGLAYDETEEVYQMAVHDLGAHYLVWNAWHRDGADYLGDQVIPTVRRHRGQINSACPTSLQNGE